jgi:hypothetical protein
VKTFHLGDILTLISVRAVSPTGLRAVKALCDHMTGRALFNHEMPTALRDCGIDLRRQFPALADLRVPHLAHPEDIADWLAAQAQRFGEQHEVTPIRTDLALTATSKE